MKVHSSRWRTMGWLGVKYRWTIDSGELTIENKAYGESMWHRLSGDSHDRARLRLIILGRIEWRGEGFAEVPIHERANVIARYRST